MAPELVLFISSLINLLFVFRKLVITTMAPEVAVPANFGKHHLKSRTHNNLELLCAEGEVQRANSMILSLNSSVIEDLIARLEITSLDMQDFAAPAVNCFVESMYSGELENCDKTNFRDLNKMGHVFDVTWFVDRCFKYFTELMDEITGICYEDILFVAEEAWFVKESIKKHELMDLVIKKLNEMKNKKSIFLKQYAVDLTQISIDQLKMVVEIAGPDFGILVSILATHISRSGASSLTTSSRFLFENINFMRCFSNRRYLDITNSLINSIIDGDFNEDFKSAVKSISFLNQSEETGVRTDTSAKQIYPVITKISIEDFMKLDWNSLCDFLSHSDVIYNIYQLFEALFMWLRFSLTDEIKSIPRLNLSDHECIRDIIDIKNDRCWGKMSKAYLQLINRFKSSATSQLLESFINCDELSFDDHGSSMIFKSDNYNINQLFSTKTAIHLVPMQRENQSSVGRKKPFLTGITIKITFGKKEKGAEHFFFDVVIDSKDADNCNCNYFGEFQIASILLNVLSDGREVFTPIPFNCTPTYDSNRFWFWGFHQFGGHRKHRCETPCALTFGHEIEAKICLLVVLDAV